MEAAFGSAPGAPAPALPAIRPAARRARTVHVVDRPGAAQTELRLGHPASRAATRTTSRWWCMNTLLGGKFTSRINLNLRERHGFTYGASSRFVPRRGPGPFLVGAAVATESTGAAAREVLTELRRIREELVEPEELEETRSYLAGIFPYTVQTIGDITKRLETLAVFELPDDYFDGYVERLTAVTREQVLEVAERHLDPERITIVAVGPAEELARQMEDLGPVEVKMRTAEPAPV